MMKTKKLVGSGGLALLLTLWAGASIGVKAQPATNGGQVTPANVAQLKALNAKMRADMKDLQAQRIALQQSYEAQVKTPGDHSQAQKDYRAQMQALNTKMRDIHRHYQQQRQSLLGGQPQPGAGPKAAP